MPRKLAAGNWKMNGLSGALSELGELAKLHPEAGVNVLICPPATLLAQANWQIGQSGAAIALGGQDCHAKPSGAHTGDISADMIADAGGTYVIVGHSERRTDHGETNAGVRAKAEAAWAAGLTAIICIGETLEEREAGQALAVNGSQLHGSIPQGATGANTVIAYEPVWAIGTGKVPTLEEIAEVHDFLRAELGKAAGDAGADIRILYGGSVKPSNAGEIFAVSNVDGALVGGASLKAADFTGIIAALEAAG